MERRPLERQGRRALGHSLPAAPRPSLRPRPRLQARARAARRPRASSPAATSPRVQEAGVRQALARGGPPCEPGVGGRGEAGEGAAGPRRRRRRRSRRRRRRRRQLQTCGRGVSHPPATHSPRLTSRAASEQESGGEHQQEKQQQAGEGLHGAATPASGPCPQGLSAAPAVMALLFIRAPGGEGRGT